MGFVPRENLKKFVYLYNLTLTQGSTAELKRMYASVCAFKNSGVHHVQGRNYEKLKKTQGL